MAEDWSVHWLENGQLNRPFWRAILRAPHCSPHRKRARIRAFRGFVFWSEWLKDWKPGSNVLRNLLDH